MAKIVNSLKDCRFFLPISNIAGETLRKTVSEESEGGERQKEKERQRENKKIKIRRKKEKNTVLSIREGNRGRRKRERM